MSMGRMFIFMLLGACEGLVLTRDENTDSVVSSTLDTAPVNKGEYGYPLTGADGIHIREKIVLAWEVDTEKTKTWFIPSPSNDKVITITPTAEDGKNNDVITIPANDNQVSIVLTKGTGSLSSKHMAYVTITPDHWLWEGREYTVAVQNGAFTDVHVDKDAQNAADNYVNVVFETFGDCKDIDMSGTDLEDATICKGWADCVWTGKACEESVIEVSGMSGATSGDAQCNGDEGTQYANTHIITGAYNAGTPGCAADACLNGVYKSRGLRNGKPVYSKDWSVPLERGGSRFQFETATSAALTEHRDGDDAGWVGICGGAVRFGAPTASTAANPGLVAAGTWTADGTNAQAGYATGTLVVKEANSCASGYSGTPTSTAGCTPPSRRRRRKHTHKKNAWPAPAHDATPCPTWWTWWN